MMMGKWLQSSETMLFEVDRGVALITLNAPEKRNAMSPQMLEELRLTLLEADDLLSVNVIVIKGAGKDFCSGYDLAGAYAGRAAEAASGVERVYRSAAQTFDDDCWGMERNLGRLTTLLEIHKPVIAQVHGYCVAGGADLASLCDIVIAADDAKIGYPPTRANGTPPINLWYYHVGLQWAKRLLLTGDLISGLDAARIGLVLDAVPAAQLEEEVTTLARRMARVDAELLSVNKRSINLAFELAGGVTLQRLTTELDARGHLAQGPRRTKFKKDIAELGLKAAVKERDAPFGDGRVRIRHLEPR
jgi:enoyl-CoA hydratase